MAVGVGALVGVFSGTPAVPTGTHHAATAPAPAAAATTTSSSAPPPAGPPPSTMVATTHGSIPGYAWPQSAAAPDMTVPGTWYGYPSVLPVIATEPGWLSVRLAQRPNGSTIWVRQSDVTLSSTP
jgi:hypothetical protein